VTKGADTEDTESHRGRRELVPSISALCVLCVVSVSSVSSVLGQEPPPPPDEAHLRREIDRDPSRAVEELNALVRAAPESCKPRLLLLRAEALAKLGEKRFALEDAKAILEGPSAAELEKETAALVRSLEDLAVELRAPAGLLAPGTVSVALVGSGRGALPVAWAV
jgi:hypothetical protein